MLYPSTEQFLYIVIGRGAGSNVKRRGQPFKRALHFSERQYLFKTLLNGYSITCGYYWSANLNLNFEQFYLLVQNKMSERTYIA